MNVLWVLIGGMVGAPARFLVDRFVQARLPGDMPWGTFTVNVAASFVLGVVSAAADPQLQLLLGTGFCGALSTYSTFSFEQLSLAGRRMRRTAWSYAVLSVLAGLIAMTVGVVLGRL